MDDGCSRSAFAWQLSSNTTVAVSAFDVLVAPRPSRINNAKQLCWLRQCRTADIEFPLVWTLGSDLESRTAADGQIAVFGITAQCLPDRELSQFTSNLDII